MLLMGSLRTWRTVGRFGRHGTPGELRCTIARVGVGDFVWESVVVDLVAIGLFQSRWQQVLSHPHGRLTRGSRFGCLNCWFQSVSRHGP